MAAYNLGELFPYFWLLDEFINAVYASELQLIRRRKAYRRRRGTMSFRCTKSRKLQIFQVSTEEIAAK